MIQQSEGTTSPGRDRDIEAAWKECLSSLKVPDAVLLGERPDRPWRRNYVHDGKLYKVLNKRLLVGDRIHRNLLPNLYQEHRLLMRCRGASSVVQPIAYISDALEEAVVIEYLDATPALNVAFHYRMNPLRLLIKLFRAVVGLSWRGVVHGDMNLENVLICNHTSRAVIIDLDMASPAGRPRAFYANLCRKNSFLRLAVHAAELTLPASVERALAASLGRRSYRTALSETRPDLASAETATE